MISFLTISLISLFPQIFESLFKFYIIDVSVTPSVPRPPQHGRHLLHKLLHPNPIPHPRIPRSHLLVALQLKTPPQKGGQYSLSAAKALRQIGPRPRSLSSVTNKVLPVARRRGLQSARRTVVQSDSLRGFGEESEGYGELESAERTLRRGTGVLHSVFGVQQR